MARHRRGNKLNSPLDFFTCSRLLAPAPPHTPPTPSIFLDYSSPATPPLRLCLPPSASSESRVFFTISLLRVVREPWQTGNRTRNPRCCRETGPGVRWCKVKAKKEAEKAPEFELVMRVENPNVSFFFSTKKEIETQNATKICFHATTSAF